MLDNLATFASFVSQFTPIKILPWQEKKNIMMILMIMINYVESSKSRWAKHFFPLQWVYTRRDESRPLQSWEYLLGVFHAEIEITNTAFTSRNVREKSTYFLILSLECTLDYWFPQQAGRSWKSIFVVTYKSHKSRRSKYFEKMIFSNVFLFYDMPRISLLGVGLEK